jgi:[acyl-carrier-protein] S-malonyltransferase
MGELAFLFPGQGAQTVGMAKDLHEAYPAVRDLYARAARAVPFDLRKISFEGPEAELLRTDVSQPAIVAASLAALEALKAELGGTLPAVKVTLGLSLGEYAALAFAGGLPVEDALALVIARGRYMQECCEKTKSGMVSVLGLDAEKIKPAIEEGRKLGPVGLANDNAPGQVVLSGEQRALDAAAEKAKALGAKRTVPLNVAGAYHSSLMAPAGERLKADLAKAKVATPTLPVLANVTAAPHGSPDEIRARLVEQVSGTVRFRESMARAVDMGVTRFVELGPGGVLKGLVRANDRALECKSAMTVDEIKAVAAWLKG